MKYIEKFMKLAIELSIKNIEQGGGPFGAVIVKDGCLVATGTNLVTLSNDPTAHAEIVAIRNASKKLNTFNLAGCDIYSSCEPCPMCLSAIYWAHIDNLFYGNTKEDAKNINFDDYFIYKELELEPQNRRLKPEQHLREKAIIAFNKWSNKADKIDY